MIMSNKFTIKAIGKVIMLARLAMSKMMLLIFSALTRVDTEFKHAASLAIESTSLDGSTQRSQRYLTNTLNQQPRARLFEQLAFQVASITGCNTTEKPAYMRGCKLPSCSASHLWGSGPWGECVWEGCVVFFYCL